MAAESKTKHIINLILRYTVLILVGFVMVYPLLWMVGATFKSNAEIFSSIGLFTVHPSLEGYKAAMQKSSSLKFKTSKTICSDRS